MNKPNSEEKTLQRHVDFNLYNYVEHQEKTRIRHITVKLTVRGRWFVLSHFIFNKREEMSTITYTTFVSKLYTNILIEPRELEDGKWYSSYTKTIEDRFFLPPCTPRLHLDWVSELSSCRLESDIIILCQRDIYVLVLYTRITTYGNSKHVHKQYIV